MLHLFRHHRRFFCTPIYESIEELVKAHYGESFNKQQISGIYHPRLESSMAYFRRNETRYPFVYSPPPDKNILGLLNKSYCMESILDNVASSDQSLKMLQILATFSDSIPQDSPILNKCLSILLDQEYSFTQLLEFVSNLSKLNAKRLLENSLFVQVVNRFVNQSLELLKAQSSTELEENFPLRSSFFRLAYFWTRYNYSISPQKAKECPYTISLVKRILSNRGIVYSLSKEEIVFLTFLIGNLRHSPAPIGHLLNYLAVNVQKMDVEEISILASALFLSRISIHSQDKLVNSLLNKLLTIHPNDVSTLEKVLRPISKSLKKATLLHIEKKSALAYRFSPILQYLSLNTRIHFLNFLSVNGSEDVKAPLECLVKSFSAFERRSESPRMKDWELIVQSLVLLNYEDKNFFLQIAEDVIDSCWHQNHYRSMKSLTNLTLYLTHRGIYKKSNIEQIFNLVNAMEIPSSSELLLTELVKALCAEHGVPLEFINTDILKSKYAYITLLRNILQLDDILRTFETDITSRLREDIREALGSFCLKYDDPENETVVSKTRKVILRHLGLEKPEIDHLYAKIFPHFRNKDIIIAFNDSEQRIEKIPSDFDPSSPHKCSYKEQHRYIVILVPKRIYLLHNQVENGYLVFQKTLLEHLGYDVVIVKSSHSIKGNLYRAIRSSKNRTLKNSFTSIVVV